jgi:hypothetical protein
LSSARGRVGCSPDSMKKNLAEFLGMTWIHSQIDLSALF